MKSTTRKLIGENINGTAVHLESCALALELEVTRAGKYITIPERKATLSAFKLITKATRYLRVVGNKMEQS